jgi:hypothetical protein
MDWQGRAGHGEETAMSEDDDLQRMKDLLFEAAQCAAKTNSPLSRFMPMAKKAWYQATAKPKPDDWKEAERVAAFTSGH